MKSSYKGLASFVALLSFIALGVCLVLKLFLDDGIWRSLVAVVALVSALIAISDTLRKKGDDRKNLYVLASSIIQPVFDRFKEQGLLTDENGKDLTKGGYVDEEDFGKELRNVTDSRERAVRELVWEKKNIDRIRKKGRRTGAVAVLFLILAFAVLALAMADVLVLNQRFIKIGADYLDGVVIGALFCALGAAFSDDSNLRYLKKADMLLSVKDRCLAILEGKEEPAVQETPVTAGFPSPAEVPAAPVVAVPAAPAAVKPAPPKDPEPIPVPPAPVESVAEPVPPTESIAEEDIPKEPEEEVQAPGGDHVFEALDV